MNKVTIELTEDQARRVAGALQLAYAEAELGREKSYIWRIITKLHKALES